MSTRHARTSDRQLNEKHTAILKALLQKPHNKLCADCKRKGKSTPPTFAFLPTRAAHPRWASWNIGVFMCIRCSGVHRSLGTHISKVKSVDLDTWTPEQVENMIRWGNRRANKYWEATLKEGHPSESSIEAWIKSKYEYKRWVMKGPIPDPATLGDGDDEITVAQPAPEPAKRDQRPASKSRPAVAQPNLNDLDAFLGNPNGPPTTGTSAPQLQGADLFDSFVGATVAHSAPVTPSPSRPDTPSAPPQLTANTSEPTTAKYNNMKSSILSLYNSNPPSRTSTPPNMAVFAAAPVGPPNNYVANLSAYQQQLSGLMSLAPAPSTPPQQLQQLQQQQQQQLQQQQQQQQQQLQQQQWQQQVQQPVPQSIFGYGVQTTAFAATLPPQQQLALHSAGFTPMLMPQGGQFFGQGNEDAGVGSVGSMGGLSGQQQQAKKANFDAAFADIANFGKQ